MLKQGKHHTATSIEDVLNVLHSCAHTPAPSPDKLKITPHEVTMVTLFISCANVWAVIFMSTAMLPFTY